ncbi:MAG TPA: proline racemase family protein [Actinomycetales bacterium]|nr:proline racemase family protein [Actinomycetales bacterium]
MAALEVRTTDFHTAGEPFRIVTAGVPPIEGSTVRERREYAQRTEAVDRIRRLLCHEPRGHADMYGCFLVPPDDDGADLAVLFWHKDGYSTACGHGTIALGEWAVRSGRVEAVDDGDTPVVVDVPSGRVTATVTRRGGVTQSVTFRNVASYVVARGVEVETGRGTVTADVSYGGAIYASVPASSVGLAVTPEHYGDLIALGREIKWALNDRDVAQHPSDPRLSGIYGTIWYDDLGRTSTGPHQRDVTVFADGEVDRSPCGSGTCARIALLADDGTLADGEVLTHDSIVGTTFTGRVVERTTAEGRPAVVPEVSGTAFPTGQHVFVLDERDPVGTGFVLR